MDKFPVMWKETVSGELMVEKDSLYTWFTVRCRLPEKGLWCAWVLGNRGDLRLGILEPAGECAVIRRRFSERMVSPLGGVLRGEIRLAAPAEKTAWEAVPNPEHLFCTPWLRKQLRGKAGVLTRTRCGTRLIAIPYDKQSSFSLTALFCFSGLQKINGAEYAVFAFNEKEEPVFW